MRDAEHKTLAENVLPVVLRAGAAEMRHFRQGVDVETKNDDTPVTAADREAEDLITAALAELHPDIPVVGEEAASVGQLPSIGDRFFLVDALDGTRDFVAGRTDFTVNVALIVETRPLFGVVYQPVTGRLFISVAAAGALEAVIKPTDAAAAFGTYDWQTLRVRRPDRARLRAAVSRSHPSPNLDSKLQANGISDRLVAGSSLKFGLLARGEADVYPRLSSICEWDTAAGHAVLQAAGGCVLALDNSEIAYGNASGGFRIVPFVAWGDRGLADELSFV